MRRVEGAVLVTGSTGFVGKVLSDELTRRGFTVVTVSRRKTNDANTGNSSSLAMGNLDGDTCWDGQLAGIGTVIHLAARAHVLRDKSSDPLAEFRRVNVAGTESLARAAASAGVQRFVYVSSIGVNGDSTGELPFTEQDIPHPRSDYAISKWEAEQVLHSISAETGLEVVIVRPPLVYGAGAPGNFARLLQVLANGIPLPFAAVANRRSLIHVGNLADALILCATHPAAYGRTYLVSDGEDISTPQLLSVLGKAMGHPARLFPFPVLLLRLAGRLTGKSGHLERLLGSLQVDSSRIRRELGWLPPYELQQGLQMTARWYSENNIKR